MRGTAGSNPLRRTIPILVVVWIALGQSLWAQQQTDPVNLPTNFDPIGIPPGASVDGTHETVNLSSGTLNVFIPVLSLPQNNGSTMTLGYLHNSATWSFREMANQTDIAPLMPGPDTIIAPPVDTSFYYEYYMQVAPSSQINLPTLSASVTAFGIDETQSIPLGCSGGECTNPANLGEGGNFGLYGVSNFVFTDWAGTAHQFSTLTLGQAIAEWDENVTNICCATGYKYFPPSQISYSTDGTFLRLNTTDRTNITVTDMHGTVYHFVGYVSPFGTPNGSWYPTPRYSAGFPQEQFYYAVASTIVDTNQNTISIAQTAVGKGTGPFLVASSTYQITDTVGRNITVSPSGIQYLDSNGNTQNVTLTNTSGPGTVPVWPAHLQLSNCTLNRGSQTRTDVVDSEPVSPVPTPITTITMPPVNGVSRKFTMQFDALGRLNQISYPAGGSTQYSYKSYSVPRAVSFGSCHYNVDQIQTKVEYPDPGGALTPSYTTTYSPSGFAIGSNLQMAVLDPLGYTTTYSFDQYSHETNRTIQNASGTLLRTTATSYFGNGAVPNIEFPSNITTTFNDISPSISKQVAYQYDSLGFPGINIYGTESFPDGLPTEIDEYDFGATTPTRTTKYTYQRGGNYTQTTNYILDRVATETVIDPSTSVQFSKTYGYDSLGNVTSKTVAGTNVTSQQTSYKRDSYGNITQITDPLNYQTNIAYGTQTISPCAASGGLGLPTSVTDALSHLSYLSYYPNTSLVACKKDVNGLVTQYLYDALNRQIKQINPDNSAATVSFNDTAPLSATTNTPIDNVSNTLTKVRNYDGLGRQTRAQVSDPDGTVFTDTVYDGLSRVLSVSNPYRTTGDSTYGITRYVYDALNRVCVVIPPDGTAVSGTACPSSQPSNDIFTVYTGNETVVKDQVGNPRTSYTDGLGRLITVVEDLPTQNSPGTQSTGYIAVSAGTCYSNSTGSCSSGSFSGSVGSYNFTVSYPIHTQINSLLGLIASQLSTSSSLVTTYVNPPNVNLTSKATGTAANYSISVGSGGSNFSIRSSGSMTGGTNPVPLNNYNTTYTYDGFDNLKTVVQQGEAVSSAWRTRSSSYDAFSRLTQSSNPESGSVTYTYDSDNNLKTKTDARGYVTTYSYDNENRLSGKSYSNGDHAIAYYYDGASPSACSTGLSGYGKAIHRRTAMCDAAGAEGWEYNLVVGTGWQTIDQRTTNSLVKATTAQDDFAGSLQTLTYPSGRVLTPKMSISGRPTSESDSSGTSYVTSAHYAPQGTLASLALGSNLTNTTIFDKRLQPCWIYATTSSALSWNSTNCSTTAATGTILDLKYNFGLGVSDNGNVIGITNNRFPTRSQGFTYDGVNRLTAAQTTSTHATAPNDCWGEQYGLDGFGNLNSITATTNSAYTGCTMETGSNNTVTNNNQFQGYCYDASGNLQDTTTCPTGSNPVHTYAYNAENQLTITAAITYLYDGDGRRVAKSFNGSINKIYWYGPNGEVLDETDGTGSTTNSGFYEYVGFYDQRIARRDSSNNVFYYVSDHLGTSRTMVQAGQTVPCYDADFYPFGGERFVTDTCGSNYKFTGKERDTESSLDNFGARYYSSAMGRFMIPDWNAKIEPVPYSKLDNPQSLNLYAYVLNNPLSNVDTDGHACESVYFNTGSGFCTRATEYGQIDARSGIQSQTRFFAAANAVSQALADVATPISGIFVSSKTANFLERVGENLQKLNESEASAIQNGSLSGPNLDQQLVHNEQTSVQGQLDSFQQSDPTGYTKAIGEINGSLNGIVAKGLEQLTGTDRAYADVLAGVRKDLGRDIDFSKQSDREAIGNALIKHVRQTGGCDLNGSKQPGCK